MFVLRRSLAAIAIASLCSQVAQAVVVDGALDAEYGAPLVTQTTQTSLGNWPSTLFYGAELDGAFAFIANDTLHLLITGSFNSFYSEPLTFPHPLQIYIDSKPGGQNPLSGANPNVGPYVSLPSMSGLAFDTDFAPDFWFAGERGNVNRFSAYFAALPAGGGGAGAFLGESPLGGPGTLAGMGADNPFGVLAALDVSNTAGVTDGCDAASGAGVTTGAEWAIPLAAIGGPTGSIRVCALLARAELGGGGVTNQLLAPVPPGTCHLGLASAVDLASVPGAQYFTIERTTPTVRASWGRIKASYRGPR